MQVSLGNKKSLSKRIKAADFTKKGIFTRLEAW